MYQQDYAPLAISSDGKYLVIGSEKGTITVYDLQEKQIVHQFIPTSSSTSPQKDGRDKICNINFH